MSQLCDDCRKGKQRICDACLDKLASSRNSVTKPKVAAPKQGAMRPIVEMTHVVCGGTLRTREKSLLDDGLVQWYALRPSGLRDDEPLSLDESMSLEAEYQLIKS